MTRMKRVLQFLFEWRQDVKASWGTAQQLLLKQLAQQYRYSWLGILWAVMPSVLTALVLMTGQQTLVEVGDRIAVPRAFYGILGLGMAQSFIEGMNSSRLLFTRNQQLFRRYKVPLDGFVIAALLDVFLNTLIRLGVVCVFFVVFQVKPMTATLPLAVIGFISVAMQGIGFGLICAPLNSLKIDFENLFMVMPWIVFAITPVFAPFSPGSIFGALSRHIPLATLFEATRAAAYGGPSDPWAVVPGFVTAVTVLVCGWIFCRLSRPYVIERIL